MLNALPTFEIQMCVRKECCGLHTFRPAGGDDDIKTAGAAGSVERGATDTV